MTYFRVGLPTTLSSALICFTTLFGMGRGGTISLQSPGKYLIFKGLLPNKVKSMLHRLQQRKNQMLLLRPYKQVS